jgi:hypothetical protein
MRCIQVLLFLLLSNIAFAQPAILKKQLSLKMNDAKIEDVLANIENFIEYHFSYEGGLFKNEDRISIDLQNKSLEVALEEILGDKFESIVLNNNIILKRNENYKQQNIEKQNVDKKEQIEEIQIKFLEMKGSKDIQFLKKGHDLENTNEKIIGLNKTEISKPTKLGLSVSPLLNMQEHSASQVSISPGIFLDIGLLNNLEFSTGISFKNQKLTNNGFDINQLKNTDIKEPNQNFVRNYTSDLYIAGMSFLIRYNTYSGKNIFFFSNGVSCTYVYMDYDYYYNQSKVKHGNYYKVCFFNEFYTSFGFERKFHPRSKFSYQLESFFSYSLTSVSPEKITPVYSGLSFRINYYLKNDL